MAIYYNYSKDENEEDDFDEDALPAWDANPIPVIYTDKKGFVNLLAAFEEEAQAALRNYRPNHHND